MNRLFRIARRQPHIVDLYTPFVYGVDEYRLKSAPNFDSGLGVLFITASNAGFADPNVPYYKIESQPVRNNVRIVFDPASYGIDDSLPFWIQLAQVIGGVEQPPSALTLVLPSSANKGVGMTLIHGIAPAGATVANSLQIDLPTLMSDFRIHNEDPTNYLYVATEAGGAEQQLKPDSFPQLMSINATQGSLYVRGADPAGVGIAVSFSASFTLAFPR